MVRVDLKPIVTSEKTGKKVSKNTGKEGNFEDLLVQKRDQTEKADLEDTDKKTDVTDKAENGETGKTEENIQKPEEKPENEKELALNVELGILSALQNSDQNFIVPEKACIQNTDASGSREEHKQMLLDSLPNVNKMNLVGKQVAMDQNVDPDAAVLSESVGKAGTEDIIKGNMSTSLGEMHAFGETEAESQLEAISSLQETMTDSDMGQSERKMQSEGQTGTPDLSGAEQPHINRVPTQVESSFSAVKDTGSAYHMTTTQETLINDMGKMLAEHLPRQNGELVVELEPASLGKLTIRVLYEAGRAQVSIMSDNLKTVEILGQHSQQLGAILRENTGQDTVIYTEHFGQQTEESFERQGRNEDNPGRDEQHGRRQRHAQTDSFAQQLRLGLI